MSEIVPFAIEASPAELEDLGKKLAMTRWPEKETPDDWSQGIPLEYMKEIHD